MKASIGVGGYDRSGGVELTEFVQEAERLGVDTAWSAEAWGGGCRNVASPSLPGGRRESGSAQASCRSAPVRRP